MYKHQKLPSSYAAAFSESMPMARLTTPDPTQLLQPSRYVHLDNDVGGFDAIITTPYSNCADWFFDIIKEPLTDTQYGHAWLYLVGPEDEFDVVKATHEVVMLGAPS